MKKTLVSVVLLALFFNSNVVFAQTTENQMMDSTITNEEMEALEDALANLEEINETQNSDSLIDYSGTDFETHQYKEAIGYLYSESIVQGYPGGDFMPENNLTRAELLKIVIKSNFIEDEYARFQGDTCFSDLEEDAWYVEYVCFAKSKSIVAGYGDDTFKPEQLVTLNESLKMIYESMSLAGPQANTVFTFKYYSPAVQSGYIPDDLMGEYDKQITRGEVSEVIYRVLMDENKEYKENINLGLSAVQQKYLASCGTAALASALSQQFTVTEDQVIEKMINMGLYPNRPLERIDDKYVWDDPQKVFVGDYNGLASIYMNKLSGFGFLEEPLEKIAKTWAPDSESFTDKDLYYIASQVKEGYPVVVFANVNARQGRVISTEPSNYTISWYARDDDRLINAPMYKHNIVVEGFVGTLTDIDKFYIVDPYYGDKIELTPTQLHNILEGYNFSGVVIKF